MSAKDYVSSFSKLSKSAVLMMCEYCGVETLAIGNSCMCSNCESMVLSTRAMIQSKDHLIVDTLDNINSGITQSKFDQELIFYDKLIAERKDPSLMYAAAIANLNIFK